MCARILHKRASIHHTHAYHQYLVHHHHPSLRHHHHYYQVTICRLHLSLSLRKKASNDRAPLAKTAVCCCPRRCPRETRHDGEDDNIGVSYALITDYYHQVPRIPPFVPHRFAPETPRATYPYSLPGSNRIFLWPIFFLFCHLAVFKTASFFPVPELCWPSKSIQHENLVGACPKGLLIAHPLRLTQ